MNQLASKASKFSTAMDESLDSCSTYSLLFVRGVDEDFYATQKLASLHSMHGAVTGENIFRELTKTFDYNNLD